MVEFIHGPGVAPRQGWWSPIVVTNSHGNHSDSSFQAQLLMLKDGPGPVLQLWLILGSLQHLSNTLCTCVNVYD